MPGVQTCALPTLPSNDTYGSRTDPLRADTDSDGLDDAFELSYYWNVTGDNNTARLWYDEEGWETSDPTRPAAGVAGWRSCASGGARRASTRSG